MIYTLVLKTTACPELKYIFLVSEPHVDPKHEKGENVENPVCFRDVTIQKHAQSLTVHDVKKSHLDRKCLRALFRGPIIEAA